MYSFQYKNKALLVILLTKNALFWLEKLLVMRYKISLAKLFFFVSHEKAHSK